MSDSQTEECWSPDGARVHAGDEQCMGTRDSHSFLFLVRVFNTPFPAPVRQAGPISKTSSRGHCAD